MMMLVVVNWLWWRIYELKMVLMWILPAPDSEGDDGGDYDDNHGDD